MSTEEKQDEIQVSSEKKPEETPSEEVESDDDNASSGSESESENEETTDETSSSKKKEKKEKKPKKSRLHRSKRESKEKEKEKKSKDETKDKKHKKIPSLFNMFSSLLTNIFSDKKAKAVESKRLKDWRESTAEIFARPTANLPIHKDLPRLAKKVIFVDRRTSAADTLPGDTISPLKNTADAPVSVYDAVGDFLWKAGFLLCGGREGAEKVRGGYDDVIKEDIALDVQSETLKQFISGLGEDHPVGRLLKGVNQSITAPANIEIHTKILQKLLFKDSQKKPWNVFVHVGDDDVTVEHVRVQTNLNQLDVDSAFEFTLVTRFVLNKELTKIVGADVFISEYEFGENTLPEKKEGLAKLFDAAPKPSQTKGFDTPPKSMAKVGVNILSKK